MNSFIFITFSQIHRYMNATNIHQHLTYGFEHIHISISCQTYKEFQHLTIQYKPRNNRLQKLLNT